MKIKKHQHTSGPITRNQIRKPTKWELDEAKAGRTVFVTDDGQRLSYVPEGYSVVDNSDKQTTVNNNDYNKGKVLDEVVVTAPRLTKEDRERLLLAKQSIQNQGTISPLTEAQAEDRMGFWSNLGDTFGTTNARNDYTQPIWKRMIDRAMWNLDSRNPSGGLYGVVTNPAVAIAGGATMKPIQLLSGLGLGYMWNHLLYPFTGNTTGELIGKLPIITSDMGDAAVYSVAGAVGPYRARVAMHDHKAPWSYGNKSTFDDGSPVPVRSLPNETARGVLQWINPFTGWKPKEMPYWKRILQSNENGSKSFIDMPAGANAEFRDMIYRQVLNLPQNKNGTVFVKNNDGTYGIDMDKINVIRRQYGGKDYDGTIYKKIGSEKYTGQDFGSHTFSTADNIAGIGGGATGYYDASTNTVTIPDIWDINPFSDWRSPIPLLNKTPLKNFEAISFLGGKPTEQVIKVQNPKFVMTEPDYSSVKVSKYR